MTTFRFDDGDSHIMYEEHGPMHGFVAIVDIGELYDCRIGFAENMEQAKIAVEAMGGEVVSIFPLVDAFRRIQEVIKKPERKAPHVLPFKDTLPL